MNRTKKSAFGWFLFPAVVFVFMVFGNPMQTIATQSESTPSRATIAVLSHTDFLPDATGVYDRRSWHGRDKNPAFAANNDLRTGSDQAYDNVKRKHGYDPEAVGLPEVLADAILEQLTKSKRFIPVERKSLRTAVIEQRFGKKIVKSYLDRTLDKAIQDMDKFEIGGGLAMPSAVAGAKYNDLLHDFKDLGTAVGADYLVLGNLHQLGSHTKVKKVPLSESGRTVTKKIAEARLRLRVIEAKTSTVVGADSLHLKVSSMLFEGGPERDDDFEFMEQVSQEAANKILDIIFPAMIVSVAPLVISRGSNDSVISGDEFTIVREGKEIKEASGVVIARLKEPVGRVKVAKVQETVSVVTIEEGSDFVDGDLAVRASRKKPPVAQSSAIPLKKPEAQQIKGLPRVAVGLVKEGSTAKTGPYSGKHVPIFTDSIITRLVQSKRFTVIDRQEVDQLLDEQTAQALAENRDLSSVMGTLKGCDYLVIGSLQNFSMEKQVIKLPNSTRVMEVLDGFSEGNMRLVDARSGDIMESRKISVKKQLDIQAGEDRLIAALADNFAAQVVANLLNAVYMIKVAAVAPDGTVYVNRGSDGMLGRGALLDVMRPGKKVIDPKTGLELGSMDSRIGQIELITVEENRSLGKMVDGSGTDVGDILKLVRSGSDDTATSGKPERSGGTLPGTAAVQGTKSKKQQKPGGKATLALTKIALNARQKFDQSSKISVVQEGIMDQLTDNVVDALAKTNRFAMMERRQIDQVIDEKIFQNVAKGGDIRDYLKELEGSDYLVIGELTNFYLHIQKKKVPYLDEYEVSYTGFMEGNNRIVDGHTSRIISTEKVRIKSKFKNIGIEEIRTRLIDMYAIETAAGIVQRIYPIRILGVLPDGLIYINRGADSGMKVGTTFSIERPGQELIDHDTGISFGAAETTIGTLKVTSVKAARSRARMIDGSTPVAGDILRNKKAAPKPKPKQKMKIAW